MEKLKKFLKSWEISINNEENERSRRDAFIKFSDKFTEKYAPELLNYYFVPGYIVRDYYMPGLDKIVVTIKRSSKSRVRMEILQF